MNKTILQWEYHHDLDYIEIEGIRYAGDFFRSFGQDMPLGQLFTLVERKDGQVIVKRVKYE